MKRKNTWVFYFFIILFTAILSAQLIWRFTPIKAEIKGALQERLAPFMGESFRMKDFSPGFGYISFYDITVGGKKQNYLLRLDEVQIGYSLHKILFHNLDPLNVIESITFKNPRLIVWADNHPDRDAPSPDSLDITRVITGFQKLAEIDRIFIRNGEIYWRKSPGKLTRVFSELDGLLLIHPEMTASLKLKGRAFDANTPDLSLSGQVNLADRNWNITAHLGACRLKNNFPFFNGPDFSIQTAEVAGEIELSCSSFNLSQMQMNGELEVRDMEALLFGQRVQTENYQIIFEGQKMLLSPVSGQVEDGRFVLTGNLGDIFHPGLYFSIDFDNYSVRHLSISAPILALLNQGKMQGHLKIAGPRKKLVITGNLYASALQYSIVPFYRTHLSFVFANKLWEFREIKTHSIEMKHTGTGWIDFNTNKMFLNINSRRQLNAHLFPIMDRLNGTLMEYHTTMYGDFPTLTFTGEVQGCFSTPEDTVLLTRANYKLVEDRIHIATSGSTPPGLRIEAEMSDLWTDPTFDILEIKNVPLDSLSTLSVVQWVSRRYKANFYFSGPVNFLSVKTNLVNRQSGERWFTFSGSAINLFHFPLKFRGRFALQSSPEAIRGNILIAEKKDHLGISLKMPGIGEGELVVNKGEGGWLSGQVELEKISLPRYLGGIPALQKAVSEGSLSGSASISGSKGNPTVQFHLRGSDFIINKYGYYTANFTGEYKNHLLSFQEAHIDYNNRPVLEADFTWNTSSDLIRAFFRGKNIESNFIAATVFNDPLMVQGDLRYEIALEGHLKRPDISGTLVMRDGILSGRPFDNLHINFQDSIPAAATLFQPQNHIIRILNFIYVDQKDYTIESNGYMSVSPRGPVDLRLNVRGNILAELPEVIRYFRNPDCVGEMNLHIKGSRINPQLAAGHLKIYNGSIEFESVIPSLKELQAELELREGEQFIRIGKIQGKLNGRFVKIYNLEKAPANLPRLKPWYFEELGLNFGVLVLETDPQGIPLSIPGLMNPGDTGYFATDGRFPGESFYFAGPPESPYIRGKVTLYESRVTFPFLVDNADTSGAEESLVVNFLMNVEWDMLAVSGLGNRYFVDIPAVIDRVYLDLNIDNVSEGLAFTGRLADESFRVEGAVESTRGRVEYLDMNFRVDRFGAVFNRFELYPEVYGRAWTTVRDSTNFPRDIYLVLYTIDPETKKEVSRGRWEDFRFKLVSSDPTIGETQEQVLAYLGYSLDNLATKAGDVGLTLTENYLIRPLVRPLERKLERGLKLDYVRFQSSFTSNLFYLSFHDRFKLFQNPYSYRQNINPAMNPALLLLQSSEITLGKYLLKDVYFTYSGQLVSVYDESKLGINHRFGLEYRLLQNLLLEIEYDKFQFNPSYYSRDALQDFRIRLRHSFNF